MSWFKVTAQNPRSYVDGQEITAGRIRTLRGLTMETPQNDMNETLITLTSDIVAAHVSNNSVSVDDLASLITNVYGALSGLGQAAPVVEKAPEPAVSIRASVKPDHIVCLEDGKKLK